MTTEKIWHYEKDGGSTGPVSEAVMLELIDHGLINHETLVWRSPLKNWVKAHEVGAFNQKITEKHSPPPLPKQGSQPQALPVSNSFQSSGEKEIAQQNPFHSPTTDDQPIESNPFKTNDHDIFGTREINRAENTPTSTAQPVFHSPAVDNKDYIYVNQIRPWVRYFARQYDYFTITLVAMAISLFTLMDPVGLTTLSFIEWYIISFSLVFIWAFIEALFISLYGTTPGKYVFGISVLNKEEKKLTYEQALGRSLRVWAKGMGMGLPFVWVITNILGYVHLTERKITSWDRDSKSTTIHDQVSVFWIIFYPILIVILYTIAITIAFYVT